MPAMWWAGCPLRPGRDEHHQDREAGDEPAEVDRLAELGDPGAGAGDVVPDPADDVVGPRVPLVLQRLVVALRDEAGGAVPADQAVDHHGTRAELAGRDLVGHGVADRVRRLPAYDGEVTHRERGIHGVAVDPDE